MATGFRGRGLPLAFALALGAGMLAMTAGGKSQPRPRTTTDPETSLPLSETLQSIGMQGGKHARKESLEVDPKDTRLYSHSPDTDSKKSKVKAKDERSMVRKEVEGDTGAGA
jgi:hypothetical protein